MSFKVDPVAIAAYTHKLIEDRAQKNREWNEYRRREEGKRALEETKQSTIRAYPGSWGN